MAWIIECLVCGDKFGSKQGLLEHYALAHPKPPVAALVDDQGLACSSRRIPAVEDFATISARLQELQAKPWQEPQVDFLCWWSGTHWEMKPIIMRAMLVAVRLFWRYAPINNWYPRVSSYSPPPGLPGMFKTQSYNEATKGFIFKEVSAK